MDAYSTCRNIVSCYFNVSSSFALTVGCADFFCFDCLFWLKAVVGK